MRGRDSLTPAVFLAWRGQTSTWLKLSVYSANAYSVQNTTIILKSNPKMLHLEPMLINKGLRSVSLFRYLIRHMVLIVWIDKVNHPFNFFSALHQLYSEYTFDRNSSTPYSVLCVEECFTIFIVLSWLGLRRPVDFFNHKDKPGTMQSDNRVFKLKHFAHRMLESIADGAQLEESYPWYKSQGFDNTW